MIDLKAVRDALDEAIEAGREDPEADPVEITNDVMARLGARHSEDVESRKEAKERLAMAAQRSDAMGDYEGAALADAVIGVGHAILAIGADAEVFFAMFSNGDASVTAYYGGEVT